MEEHPRPRRRVRTLNEAHELVAAWKSSGQNKEAWCRSQGILRSSLLSCLSRVEERARHPRAGFIEVLPPGTAAASTAPPALALELGHGMRVVGFDAAGVLALVRALRAGSA